MSRPIIYLKRNLTQKTYNQHFQRTYACIRFIQYRLLSNYQKELYDAFL